MSMEPRNSPARRRRLAEGRTQVAALVAAASLIAGITVGTPTLAEDAPDAALIVCTPEAEAAAEAAGETTTYEEQCPPAEESPPAEGSGDGDNPPADPPAATPPPAAAPPPPAETTDTPPPPPAAAEAAAAPDPAPAAEPATPAPAAESAADPAPAAPAGAPAAAAVATPADGHGAKAAAKYQGKSAASTAVKTAKASDHAGADASARGSDAQDGSDAKAESKSDGDHQSKKTIPEARTDDAAQKLLHDAVSYDSLPASWTSLAPLSLPAFSVEGFPIPPFLLPIFQAAAAQYGVPWQILASINEIETNFGRNAGVSSAGAMGWMQFIYSSWERWGTDSDADGRRDPRNPVDAIFAAARYLRDAGAATNLPKAVFAYNHAGWYVDQVVERAREFAGLDKTLVAALTERALREDTKLYRAPGNPFAGRGAIDPKPGQALLLTKRQLMRIVLHSGDIEVYPGGRQDIADGRVDRRVLATLVFLARSGLKPSVSSLQTGHSLMTTGGSISAHSYGHAVDISAINGVPIIGHQGADSITATTLAKLVRLQGYLEPNQIISLMTVDGHDNTMSMGDHDDHIHVGFPRVPKVPEEGRPADIRKLVAALRTHQQSR